MDNSDNKGMHIYDGDPGEPIFKTKDNFSTYYDYVADRQCKVPIRDISEVREELKKKHRKS